MSYPNIALAWNPAYRAIPTRFPAINLFDRVAGEEDFEALYALEAMTNDRIRDEIGEITLVPPDERLFGPGSGPIMAAFTHPNPEGSRFGDGSYGVFYCAHDKFHHPRRNPPPRQRVHARHAGAAHAPPNAALQRGGEW